MSRTIAPLQDLVEVDVDVDADVDVAVVEHFSDIVVMPQPTMH